MTAGWFLYTNVCWRLLFIISRVWQLVFLSSAGCSSSPSAKQTTKKIAYTAAEDSNSIEGYCSLTPAFAICRKLSLSLSRKIETQTIKIWCAIPALSDLRLGWAMTSYTLDSASGCYIDTHTNANASKSCSIDGSCTGIRTNAPPTQAKLITSRARE